MRRYGADLANFLHVYPVMFSFSPTIDKQMPQNALQRSLNNLSLTAFAANVAGFE